mmetsp:Transcript_148758/g.386788  ORF Transcript_148758/g.386788 Transcript_148758/m.386788 type:complete len:268 (-) Transcript_148758:371-1174(-)
MTDSRDMQRTFDQTSSPVLTSEIYQEAISLLDQGINNFRVQMLNILNGLHSVWTMWGHVRLSSPQERLCSQLWRQRLLWLTAGIRDDLHSDRHLFSWSSSRRRSRRWSLSNLRRNCGNLCCRRHARRLSRHGGWHWHGGGHLLWYHVLRHEHHLVVVVVLLLLQLLLLHKQLLLLLLLLLQLLYLQVGGVRRRRRSCRQGLGYQELRAARRGWPEELHGAANVRHGEDLLWRHAEVDLRRRRRDVGVATRWQNCWLSSLRVSSWCCW